MLRPRVSTQAVCARLYSSARRSTAVAPERPAAAHAGPVEVRVPWKWKAMALTAGFAVVTITGTMYGAGLKTQRQWQTEKKRAQEASLDDKVAMLEQRRGQLFSQKVELEKKLSGLRERMAAKDAERR